MGMPMLRLYQEQAVDLVLDFAERKPNGRVLVVLPPRGGKTLIAATLVRLMAYDQQLRALWYAHRGELVDTAIEHLFQVEIPADAIGILMGARGTEADALVRANSAAPIQVGSDATIILRDAPIAHLVVSDEAHRDASRRRRAIRERYRDALHVGITGTPIRGDRADLADDYDEMIVVVQPSELIHDGYLSVPTIFAPPDDKLPDLKGLRTVRGDFDAGALEKVMLREPLLENIVIEWERLAEQRSTLVFPVGVEHSKALVQRFQAAGVAAEHLDGDTPRAARGDLLQSFREGTVRVLSAVDVLSEGVNLPEAKCVGMVRPTKSLGLFIQQSLRCATPWRDVRPVILDHAGNTFRHGFPYEDRSWSLTRRETKSERKGKSQPMVKRCPGCGTVVRLAAVSCPSCDFGFKFEPEFLDMPATSLEAVKFTPEQVAQERRRLERFAAERGFKAGWVERVVAAKFNQMAATATS